MDENTTELITKLQIQVVELQDLVARFIEHYNYHQHDNSEGPFGGRGRIDEQFNDE